MVAAKQALTFRHWKSFGRDWAAEVAVKCGKDETTYAVRASHVLPSGARCYEVLKQGEVDAYLVTVFPRGASCTCPGSTHRHQRGTCRHRALVAHLVFEGVL